MICKKKLGRDYFRNSLKCKFLNCSPSEKSNPTSTSLRTYENVLYCSPKGFSHTIVVLPILKSHICPPVSILPSLTLAFTLNAAEGKKIKYQAHGLVFTLNPAKMLKMPKICSIVLILFKEKKQDQERNKNTGILTINLYKI